MLVGVTPVVESWSRGRGRCGRKGSGFQNLGCACNLVVDEFIVSLVVGGGCTWVISSMRDFLSSMRSNLAVLANININFTSAILFMSEVVKHFQQHPCRKVLVSISSGAARKAYSGWSLYCSSKAGLESYIRTVAVEQESESHPFVVLNVDPGVMDTDMQALIRSSHKDDFPAVDYFIHRKESGELRTPDMVAAGIIKILHSDAVSGERVAVFG